MCQRNTNLTIHGVETLVVGIYMAWQQETLKDDPHSPAVHFMHHLGETDWAALLIGLGIIVTIYGMTGIDNRKVTRIFNIMMGGLWFAYSAAFFIQDMDFGLLKLTTIMSFFVFVSIVTSVFCNHSGGAKR